MSVRRVWLTVDELRILFFAASPADHVSLDVEAEFKDIESEFDRSPHPDRFDCRFVPAVRRADLLRQLLKFKPQVVHFSGHGTTQDVLLLENDHGLAEPVGADELELLFETVPPQYRPHVVVFNACYSEVQAIAVTKVIDCAIGMASAIEDRAALAFAQGFYLALSLGLTVDRAVASGRLAMPSGMGTLPILHVRAEASLSEIKLVGRGPVSRFPTELHIDRIEQIESFRSMLEVGDPRVLVVTADGNMGKTRLMLKMARVAAAHIVALTDLAIGTPTPEDVLSRLGTGVGLSPMPPAAPMLDGRDVAHANPELAAMRQAALRDFTRVLLTAANQLGAQRGVRVVFILDGFDDPNGDVPAWVENVFLPGVFQFQNVACVLSGRVKPQIATHLHLVQEHRLANFAVSDVREVMELLRMDASDRVVRTFWIATDKGHPYVTGTRLEELWRDAIGSKP